MVCGVARYGERRVRVGHGGEVEEAGEGVGHRVAHTEVHYHAGEDDHDGVVHDRGRG